VITDCGLRITDERLLFIRPDCYRVPKQNRGYRNAVGEPVLWLAALQRVPFNGTDTETDLE